MTSFAAPATGAGITLVGEIVDLDSRSGSELSSMSVRWLGVTVGPSREAPEPPGDRGSGAAGETGAATADPAWGSGAFLASAMRAADGGGASFIPPQRSGDDQGRADGPDRDRRAGRRGLTGSIRRLIDGPQGRHRRTHH
ncbi:hypothetical protein Athai_65420 [Actinocatenispora thailandica]|uniref:Uncharacterized protein n=1 Tax=Actinocatenispora thailandica TaxID=227318 RepID=A0A7R7DWH6_9ACTN|nr:hypothetical protein [Actinocatenispora thailandica]BCJ39039.1 hypothetical protein Athai_65420 [Actinocatenispora thailandica]